MRPVSAALGFLLLVNGSSYAQDTQVYRCSLGDLQRRVEVFHETGVTVPCEVHYYKDTEAPGERQVLWSASSVEGFCETKAAEFVGQLRGWGWDCTADAAPPPEPSIPADDTGDLAPSEPGEETGS
ncbi:MAG: hypothetical protein OEW35_02960 [Gammaproteobacteria bacterium]|nr:hypothetical protein [Gammaproteobacteria bacterium]MDH4254461.1 hypothetical protein [Gammaproteobacteria bacterium]MDH5309416.1 hypothetical protein [Gammaproteobacteria bacterium]